MNKSTWPLLTSRLATLLAIVFFCAQVAAAPPTQEYAGSHGKIEALAALPPPAYTITLYDLHKDLGGVSSRYVMTNAGLATASILHTFYENDGTSVHSELHDLAAGHSQAYDLASLAGLPNGYTGYGVMSSDQPITGSVLATPDASVEVTLGPQGGGLAYTDTQGLTTTVQVPPGALSQPTTLLYTPLDTLTQPISPGLRFAGHAFDIDAYQASAWQPGLVFSNAVTVTVRYTDSELAGLDESTLALRYWNGSAWASDGITPTERLTASHSIVHTITHLSRFALFGSTRQAPLLKVFLPVVLR